MTTEQEHDWQCLHAGRWICSKCKTELRPTDKQAKRAFWKPNPKRKIQRDGINMSCFEVCVNNIHTS